MASFRWHDSGIVAHLDAVEADMLRHLLAQLLQLLADNDGDAGDDGPRDPLEELVGLHPGGSTERPQDAALARLLPDAYPKDDAASAEFRRYTESDLRSGKRAAAQAVLDTLPRSGGRVHLDESAAAGWLAATNDLRLALGTRLDIRRDDIDELEDIPADDPRAPMAEVYRWLGGVEERLVHALAGW